MVDVERKNEACSSHCVESLAFFYYFSASIVVGSVPWIFKSTGFDSSHVLRTIFPDMEDFDSIPDITKKTRKAWAQAFFSEKTRLCWVEPPSTDKGKANDVWHYRLFIDEHGIPLLPRGEVYSARLTNKRWKSWSEVHSEQ